MNAKLITTAFAGLAISSLSVAEVTLPVEAESAAELTRILTNGLPCFY
mgnify:CR=1 FL=1